MRIILDFFLTNLVNSMNLGDAGTRIFENDYIAITYGSINVARASQLFKDECFEEICEYSPFKYYGINWIAIATLRIKIWKTN